MRVLFLARTDLFVHPGGDTIQVLETQSALQSLGVSVDLDTGNAFEVRDYDIAHVFNLNRIDCALPQVTRARKTGVPTALSPIYWSPIEFILRGMTGHPLKRSYDACSRMLPLGRHFISRVRDMVTMSPEAVDEPELPTSNVRFRFERGEQREALRLSDVVLPNSLAEAKHLAKQFGMASQKLRVVHNGVRPGIAEADPNLFVQTYGMMDFVVCSGRIEDRKNSLRLIRACNTLGLPLVLIGRRAATQYTRRYVDRCVSEAKEGKVLFVSELPGGDPMLYSAYKAAKVHALPSWYETPGLSSLEAAVCGCNIVTTNRGSTIEYFGPLAWYCNPASERSIRQAVAAAHSNPRRLETSRHVLAKYTWQAAALQTLEAYSILCPDCVAGLDLTHGAAG